MPEKQTQAIRLVSPGNNGQVINEYGLPETPPTGWQFLPAGDAAITRKATKKGPVWRVQIKRGRRIQSTGIWAPQEHIVAAKAEVESMRATPDYAKKKVNAAKRRDKKQEEYIAEFEQALIYYLNFQPRHQAYATEMAKRVAAHATPVGSGTVARTVMIPIEERASRAVIAWMRHQTSAYDTMKIARIKGERRAIRRQIAERSVQLLRPYRQGAPIPLDCPLRKVLSDNL